MSAMAQKIFVIDSHTGGEPTRVAIAGGPELGGGTMAERARVFREKYDHFRSAVVNEPRGSDVVVGALLVEPVDKTCAAGVIFFNNIGTLGMCGHGTIGLIVTLAHMGRIGPGDHRIETSVGVVTATLHSSGEVSVRNVPSYRLAKASIQLTGHRIINGDVAWSGNWFYLVTSEHQQRLELDNVEILTDYTWEIRQRLKEIDVLKVKGADVDHVELFGPPHDARNHSRNFVLCPGKAYDRSPCGTGTSAKLACLYADGKLKPGEIWRQESILGSVFEGSVTIVDGQIIPTIKGSAFVTAESTLILQDADPFKWGIRETEPSRKR